MQKDNISQRNTFIVRRALAFILWKKEVYLICLDSRPQWQQFICSKMSIPNIECAIQVLFAQSQDPMQLLSADSASETLEPQVNDRWRQSKITPSTSEASFIWPCQGQYVNHCFQIRNSLHLFYMTHGMGFYQEGKKNNHILVKLPLGRSYYLDIGCLELSAGK